MKDRGLARAGARLAKHIGPRAARYATLTLYLLRCIDPGPSSESAVERRPTTAEGNHTQRLRVPEAARFRYLLSAESGVSTAAAVDDALATLEHANPEELAGLSGLFSFRRDIPLPPQARDNLLREFTVDVAGTRGAPWDEVSKRDAEVVALLDEVAGRHRGEGAQAPATQRCLAELLVALLEPRDGERIYDPACRNGELLVAAARRNRGLRNAEQAVELFGEDAEPFSAATARIYATLLRLRHDIRTGHILVSPQFTRSSSELAQFDVVGSVTPTHPHALTSRVNLPSKPDSYGRFEGPITPNTHQDPAFMRHLLASMAPIAGRAAGVFPYGLLTRRTEAKLRRMLIQDNLLDAVIKLPEKILYESRFPCALLLLKRSKPDDSVLFVDASNDFDYGRYQNTLSDSHINHLLECYRGRRDEPGYSHTATPAEMEGYDFNLHVPLYVPDQPARRPSVAELSLEHENLLRSLQRIDRELQRYISDVGG